MWLIRKQTNKKMGISKSPFTWFEAFSGVTVERVGRAREEEREQRERETCFCSRTLTQAAAHATWRQTVARVMPPGRPELCGRGARGRFLLPS